MIRFNVVNYRLPGAILFLNERIDVCICVMLLSLLWKLINHFQCMFRLQLKFTLHFQNVERSTDAQTYQQVYKMFNMIFAHFISRKILCMILGKFYSNLTIENKIHNSYQFKWNILIFINFNHFKRFLCIYDNLEWLWLNLLVKSQHVILMSKL